MSTKFTAELGNLKLSSKNQLRGSENYKDWLRSVTSRLINKDVYDVASGDDTFDGTDEEKKKWKKADRLAWSIIDSSLDRLVHNSLLTTLVEVGITPVMVVSINLITGLVSSESYAQSYLLLKHLRKASSAAKASRRIKLLRLVWRTVIEEGEDPSKAMGDMREAFNDLNGAASLDNKASSLSDYDLASAILLALPQSFLTLVSALMLRDTLTSSEVISSVSDDYC
jgi:hypothetical protein